MLDIFFPSTIIHLRFQFKKFLHLTTQPHAFVFKVFHTFVLLSNNLYYVLFQVGFYMMCRVKCVAITVRENIMGFLRVMDAQASLNDQYVDLAIMYVRQRPKEIALLIKRIGINAVPVAWKNALKLV